MWCKWDFGEATTDLADRKESEPQVVSQFNVLTDQLKKFENLKAAKRDGKTN